MAALLRPSQEVPPRVHDAGANQHVWIGPHQSRRLRRRRRRWRGLWAAEWRIRLGFAAGASGGAREPAAGVRPAAAAAGHGTWFWWGFCCPRVCGASRTRLCDGDVRGSRNGQQREASDGGAASEDRSAEGSSQGRPKAGLRRRPRGLRRRRVPRTFPRRTGSAPQQQLPAAAAPRHGHDGFAARDDVRLGAVRPRRRVWICSRRCQQGEGEGGGPSGLLSRAPQWRPPWRLQERQRRCFPRRRRLQREDQGQRERRLSEGAEREEPAAFERESPERRVQPRGGRRQRRPPRRQEGVVQGQGGPEGQEWRRRQRQRQVQPAVRREAGMNGWVNG
mmetsp:Transcript_7995/g.20526  ORF Transcript_7995/g.20526 Transcript_7995/m.20526 type:complete len:334 (+) Transcript_7995:496-1497(+)